jgi:hypothetical protein
MKSLLFLHRKPVPGQDRVSLEFVINKIATENLNEQLL